MSVHFSLPPKQSDYGPFHSHTLEFTTAPWVLGGQGIIQYQHVLDPVAYIRGR